ncbi:hypothetical protein [Taibaiella chishuiensis]|uniref:Uncharacterized protein n=1 Tax=Taibaiella chishuiensis TaxID=1434707 RepID=A0A2P8D7B9_9BACT|nr:hypothetical protein [Taibaiella chishuiensis]PSK93102.1 hypothetical protein B0I18_10271 [Taibaiella chishuiensis]
MKKINITIIYTKNFPLLIALKVIREYSDLAFETISPLIDLFHKEKEVRIDAYTKDWNNLLSTLKFTGFNVAYTENDILITGWDKAVMFPDSAY